MTETFKTIKIHLDGPVATILFDRPQHLNSLNDQMADELRTLFCEIIPNSDARVVVVSGNGDHFMAGADLDRLETWAASSAERVRAELTDGFNAGMVEALPMPVVAAVDGVAMGIGFNICLAADIVIATNRAVFALPEVDVGVVPLGGTTRALSYRVGLGRAKQMVLLGERIRAEHAHEWGLAAAVVEPGDLQEAVDKLVSKLVRRSQLAMRAGKRLMRMTMDMSPDEACAAERDEFLSALRAADLTEGIAAVRERRPPQFQ